MEAIAWFGEHFIGMFQAGADTFWGYITGIVPLVIVLMTAMNSVVAFIGEQRVENAMRKASGNVFVRYLVMPVLAALILCNPMAYTWGRFLDEKYKPAFYDSCVSFMHAVTGLFPHANGGELFVWLGIANGVQKAGYSIGSLAVWYFVVGLIVIFIRGLLCERFTLWQLGKQQKNA
ncbi:MAG: PTS glucitol/sorbitol transporter subunit IIC [Atopobiaceae bacterium]|jgi:PTS system glucitol/sorbitol-specific IIC component|nr:PTS glucitol/sorbitol transporter subunit IIC [Atopobiaceae bacterium]MCH4119451.1 PTS glucitol/sorbitol transporter subunit IIC [Atopobiaceae bacterium]MCI1318987.1 PTS glucitol/sorbitol transporter subunit IIC [Atopobiaceae bacterium]MCI1389038.1 PTS glucitol/sorbitol transporter subunit IIC [Atopobiaceae bacterium]MCI1431728.1 PTS glucitol/sorbitol transporter subunit IIC [Atopobiaceae bacterium]